MMALKVAGDHASRWMVICQCTLQERSLNPRRRQRTGLLVRSGGKWPHRRLSGACTRVEATMAGRIRRISVEW
jgi:hypothetical protein